MTVALPNQECLSALISSHAIAFSLDEQMHFDELSFRHFLERTYQNQDSFTQANITILGVTIQTLPNITHPPL